MKMKTIKETLDNLKDHERQQLMYGFEHEFAQYVCLNNGTFIGVNVENIQHLEIKEKAGVWAVGVNHGKDCNDSG
jgi:hypothetical protein